MIRPTRRALILVLAGLPLALAALVEGSLWTIGVAYAALALTLIGIDAARAVPPSRLPMVVRGPTVLGVDVQDELVLDFAGAPATGVPALEALCDIAGEPGAAARRPVMAGGVGPAARVPIRPSQRGEITVERVWMRWQGPWGLIVRQEIRPCGHSVRVTPDVARVQAAATQFTMRDAYVGIKVRKELGGGTDFDALAEYVPGQDRRAIDWKRSARHRKLLVKEFQAERNHNVILAIDTGHLMSEPLGGLARLDHAINSGLLLAYLSLRTGDRVGLMGFDARVRRFVAPQHGVQGFPRLLDASAQLEYQSEETNFTLAMSELSSRLNRRALVVLFTEFVDTVTAELMVENMGRLARRHLVLFVTMDDPALSDVAEQRPGSIPTMAQAVIARDMIRDKAVVIERIRRLGVHCLNAPAPSVAAGLIDRYLTIRREELV